MKPKGTACKTTRARLKAWLDGELSSDEARRVGAHIAECDLCRSESHVYERIRNRLVKARVREPSPPDVAEIRRRALRARAEVETLVRWCQRAAAAAAALLVVACIGLAGTVSPERRSPPGDKADAVAELRRPGSESGPNLELADDAIGLVLGMYDPDVLSLSGQGED